MAISPCYVEYPEFPRPPLDPALFGFSSDLSSRLHLRQCPCFSTGEYHLWLNWPQPEEREWYPPMARYFITSGVPEDIEATVHFEAELLQDLFRHLLTTRYATNRPIIDSPCTLEMAQSFFQAAANAGFLSPRHDSSVIGALDRDALAGAAPAADRYLEAIDALLGQQAVKLLTNAIVATARF